MRRKMDNQRMLFTSEQEEGKPLIAKSLAERVRRGNINDRLKCLQDVVPSCYKFLSMRITAASKFYDFNSGSEPIQALQRAKAQEVAEIETLMKEANAELACLQPT